MNIFISTSQSENSFLFNKENEPIKTLPKVYQLKKDITNIKQNKLDDTKGFSISCVNLFTKEILFSGKKLEEVFVDGQVFGSYTELSAALTPILFKLGGSPGAGGAENIPRLITLTLDDLRMTSSNTEAEINQALADYINGLELTIGEKDLYFFQVVTDTIKKTYLIKDQGKGLVENLTPDKLFDISSGGSGGNIDLKWENITGDQKTVRLEDFQDGGERYFLEKIINSNVSDICNNDENNILMGIIDGNLHYSTDNFVTSTQVLSNVNGIFKENNSLYTTVFHFNQLGEPSLSLYSSIDGINWVNENLTFNPDEAAINLRIVNGQLTIFESISSTGTTKIHTHINGIWSYQEISIYVDNIINLGGVPYYHYNSGPIKHAYITLYDVTTLAPVFSYGGLGDTFEDIIALDNDVFIASFTKYPGLLRAFDTHNFNQLSEINLPLIYRFFKFIDKTIAVCQDGIAEITYDLVNGLKYKFFNLSLNIYDITYGSNVGDDILLTIYNDGVQAIRYENGLKFENTIEEINFNGAPVEVINKVANIIFENTDSDYSIDEIQVGKFIYAVQTAGNTNKVSKPKYRKLFSSHLGTRTNPNTGLETDGFGIIQLSESIDHIISISAEFDLWLKKIGFGLSVFRNALIGPVREVINHVNIGYSLSENGNEIYIDGFVKTLDEALTPSETTTYHLPNGITYQLYIEYTKTSDEETFIESLGGR